MYTLLFAMNTKNGLSFEINDSLSIRHGMQYKV